MIYTITLNPAIDLVMEVSQPELGKLNRSEAEEYVVGGKGVNVSTMLARFQLKSIATGFIAGFTGDYIVDAIRSEWIQPEFVQVSGVTRVNVKLRGDQETEINGSGPMVEPKDFERLIDYLKAQLTEDSIVFLTGNVARGLESRHYQEISQVTQVSGGRLVLDTTKNLLKDCLKFKPFVIKPNIYELEEIFERTLDSQASIIAAAHELQAQGAENVLVSMGGEGALLITQDEVYQVDSPHGTVINSVGAGDSMLAGFMAHYIKTEDYAESLRMGTASGSATAFSMGIAEFEKIQSLANNVVVNQIEE